MWLHNLEGDRPAAAHRGGRGVPIPSGLAQVAPHHPRDFIPVSSSRYTATPGTELPLKGTVVFGMALSFYSLNPTEKHEPSNRHRQAHHRFCPAWSSVLGLVSRGTIKNTFQMVKNLEQGLKEQAPRYNLESCPNLCLIDGSYTLLFSLGLHVNSVVT